MADIIDYSQLSMIEVAKVIVKNANVAVAIKEIIDKVLELKNMQGNSDKATQLYVDITTSADFVYMGESCWDLKDNQPLDEWDKDASAFNSHDDEEENEEDITADDYDLDEESKVNDDEDSIDEEIDDTPIYSTDDDDDNSDFISEFDEVRDSPDADEFDEDKYGDIMDSYEDLYDK